MKYQIPFYRFGGGPNGPNNIAKQVIIILGAWIATKICIRPPEGSDGHYNGITNPTKYRKPMLLSH